MVEGQDAFHDPDFSRLYEWSYADYDADIPFWQGVAEQHGDPVLEVACGTGRVLIPLARDGHEVVGIDSSPAMLEIARQKLAAEPEPVRRRVTLQEADMLTFDLGRQFPSVLVPNASLFELEGPYSITRCFRQLYRHTRPGGVAVVDCVAPRRMADQDVGAGTTVKEGVNPETGLPTRELNQKLSIDWHSRVAHVEHTYVEGEGDQERRHVFRRRYRWLTRKEGEELLQHAGFPVVEALGDFEGNPYAPDSPRLILVARRLERDFV
ncbi:MAG: class I SAM-dependent methyltransferase [Candidatus Brocadiia bacterium]